MIYKFISSQQVIAKVLADLDISEESIRSADCREWCAEAVEKIGSVKQLKRNVSGVDGLDVLTVSGYQTALPYDLYRLNSVAYSTNSNGPWTPMTISTGSFGTQYNPISSTATYSYSSISNNDLVQEVMAVYGLTYAEAIVFIADQSNSSELDAVKALLVNRANSTSVSQSSGYKYSIKPGFIMVNANTGYLKLSYDSIHVDSSGYPMIPDLMSYIEAVYWYITMKLKYPEYLSGRMNREIYYDIRRSWNFYAKQAYGESMMPTQDEMETIKNVWLKLVPDVYANDSMYEGIGEVQSIKNANR